MVLWSFDMLSRTRTTTTTLKSFPTLAPASLSPRLLRDIHGCCCCGSYYYLFKGIITGRGGTTALNRYTPKRPLLFVFGKQKVGRAMLATQLGLVMVSCHDLWRRVILSQLSCPLLRMNPRLGMQPCIAKITTVLNPHCVCTYRLRLPAVAVAPLEFHVPRRQVAGAS